MSESLPENTSLNLPPHEPAFDPRIFPSRKRSWLQLLVDHNPCLLLSTVLMLLGCYLVNGSIDVHAGDQGKLLSLLGVTNLYEACIIALGLLLIRRAGGVARDGLWLLLFETLFLVNGTFLNVDPSVFGGWWLNGVLFGLSCVKAGIILRGVGIKLSPRVYGFVVGQLAIIYGLPIFLVHASVDGHVPEYIMYGLYWVVGLLPVAYDLLARAWPGEVGGDAVRKVVRRTYVVVPWVLLVAHLGFSHWAHHSDFAVADVAPLLFGLTVAASRVGLNPTWRALVRILPAVAFLLSLGAPEALSLPVAFGPALPQIPPELLALVGMATTYAYVTSMLATAVTIGLICCFAGIYLMQDWIGRILRGTAAVGSRSMEAAWSSVPATSGAWGALAIGVAFVLLGLGSWRALRQPRHRDA
jgi:hypothetical protein